MLLCTVPRFHSLGLLAGVMCRGDTWDLLVTSSKALVTRSDALVTNSFLLLVVRHLLLEAMHLLLIASCY